MIPASDIDRLLLSSCDARWRKVARIIGQTYETLEARGIAISGSIAKLMDALERGQSEALKLYLAMMSRFHRYSWGNILLIYSQRPDASHVAGFHAWLKLRRFVRKGEKGIVILAPMVGCSRRMRHA